MKRKILYVLIVSSVALAGCDSKTKNTEKMSMPMITVQTVTAKSTTLPIINDLNGRTVSTFTAKIRPQISGIIQSRNFTEGDHVNKGDVLYKIDPATYQAAYDQAVAELQTQNAKLQSAKLKYQRYQSLVKGGNVSQQDYEDAQSDYQQTLASIASSKANVLSAKINLDRTIIRAPISGYVGISDVTPGALVTADQTDALTTIRDLDSIYVDLTQSSLEALKLKQDNQGSKNKDEIDNVSLILEDGSTYKEKGTLLLSDFNVDESTGSVTLRAVFPNKDHLLLPGMFVRARVNQGVINNAFLVPEQSLFRNNDGSAYVMLVENGKVVDQNVSAGNIVDHKYVVTSGLKDSDQIITMNSNKVSEGQQVSIQNNEEVKK